MVSHPVIETLLHRKSIRAYTGQVPSDEVVETIVLAGHGASGRNRTRWTTPAFGQDVVAVVEQLGLRRVVLIGHSMGGAVIVEVARHLSAGVIGLVGAETWHDVGHNVMLEDPQTFNRLLDEAVKTFIHTRAPQ